MVVSVYITGMIVWLISFCPLLNLSAADLNWDNRSIERKINKQSKQVKEITDSKETSSLPLADAEKKKSSKYLVMSLATSELPRWCSGKESVCQCRRYRSQVQSLVLEDPLEKEWQPIPVFLPRKYQGQRNLESYSPWGCKESDTT